jgi:glycosyltransferase involved in cell wall biosynthesis
VHTKTKNKLTILIPAYNEERTIVEVLNKIKSVTLINNIGKEIVIIDDCSSDGTARLIYEFQQANPQEEIKYVKHSINTGKGGAIHTGISEAKGSVIIVQDADLEYDPNEYNILLKPLDDGVADVVYGSRFMGGNPHRILFFWHTIGNKFLTFLSNLFTNLNLTDMETGYKIFSSEIIKNLILKEKRFGFEPEVTAKISKLKGIRIYEVGISYYGRTYQEGKKINWRDGLRAIYCIIRYNLLR